MALHLRAAQRCKVIRPPWLSVPALEAAIERERASEFELTPLPHFYVEIAEILLRQATEDWGSQLDATADLLEELIVVRASKLKRGTSNVLKGTKGEGIMKDLIVPVTSIAAAEVNSLRHGFLKVRPTPTPPPPLPPCAATSPPLSLSLSPHTPHAGTRCPY